MKDAHFYIQHLRLRPHPEGGWYRETYRASEILSAQALPARFGGERSFSTAIYYLLQQGDFSHFHRIKSDECWHWYAGDCLLIHVIEINGDYNCIKLGCRLEEGEVFQFVVSAGAWFAAEPAHESLFVLTGCTVAPGFDYRDFEMASGKQLTVQYPQLEELIKRLCRE